MFRIMLTTLSAAALLAALPQSSDAGCGYGGGYRGHYARRAYTPVYHAPVYRAPVVVHRPVVVQKPLVVAPVADHCFHPHHRYTWVLPGESLDAICLREYGDASLWQRVAQYNGCTTLAVGQKLLLPSIYASGRMIPSSAPAPAPAAIPTATATATAIAIPTAAGI